MKKKLSVFALSACCLFGNQSLQVAASGPQVAFTVPNAAPWNNLNDFRVGERLHDFILPLSGNVTIGGLPGSGVSLHLYANGYLCAIGGIAGDVQGDYGGLNCIYVAGLRDVTIRYQRFHGLPAEAAPPSHGYAGQTEVMAVDNGAHAVIPMNCGNAAHNSFPCPLSPTGGGAPFALTGNSNWGNAAVAYSIAWMKWWSTTVPPGSPMEDEDTPADLADFRFEGNLVNSATTPGVTMSGNATFGPSAIETPGCFPLQATYRVGQPATLINNSYTLDGSAPSFAWSEISGPSTLYWSATDTAQPSVTGAVRGTYNLQLAVSGSGGGGSTTCPVKIGFVVADGNGIVTTGDNRIDALIGPVTQDGENPWPWADAKQRSETALVMHFQQPGQYYANAFWLTPDAGTITFTTGSKIVTGVGTAFDTRFCGGAGNATPLNIGGSNVLMDVWYPNAAVPGGTGRRKVVVASCQGPGQITLQNPWNQFKNAAIGDCQAGGCSYNYDDFSSAYDGIWVSNAYPGNFYDPVTALYVEYVRTGIDTYLNAFRTLADHYWVNRLDSGRNYYVGEGLNTYPRNRSILGMVLRALDGRPDMWSGLELMFAYEEYEINSTIRHAGGSFQPGQLLNTDERESGYIVEGPALCAIADTQNPAAQAGCRAALVNAVENGLKTSRFPDGYWYGLQQSGSGCGVGGTHVCAGYATGTTVMLTNGSTAAVVCDMSGNCPATAGGFSSGTFIFNLNGAKYPAAFWFLNSTTAPPTSNASGDPIAYFPTFVDAYHFTLDQPYQGTTGLHGWSTGGGATGFGLQPYMVSIMGTALDFTSQGLACGTTKPLNCNDQAAEDAKTFNIAMATYNRLYGYNPAVGGMFYATGYVNCQPPIAPTNPGCTDLNNVSQATALSAEALRGVMTAYHNSNDPLLLAFGDTLYTQMWGKPGIPLPPGQVRAAPGYAWDYEGWDAPQTGGLGNYTTGVPGTAGIHKYAGMAFGIGDSEAWPGYRVGGRGASLDLNGDGVVDALDVELMVQEVLATQANPAACVNDVNHDGVCDVLDVEAVVAAVLH